MLDTSVRSTVASVPSRETGFDHRLSLSSVWVSHTWLSTTYVTHTTPVESTAMTAALAPAGWIVTGKSGSMR